MTEGPLPKRKAVGIAIASLLACAGGGSNQFGTPADKASNQVEAVSLVQLIATPLRFEGKRVWVSGVIRVEFEENRPYMTREHYQKRLWDYGVGLSFDEDALRATTRDLETLNGRYVLVEGIFSPPPTGGIFETNGAITKVSQIRLAP
jgi:hypothetical protein